MRPSFYGLSLQYQNFNFLQNRPQEWGAITTRWRYWARMLRWIALVDMKTFLYIQNSLALYLGPVLPPRTEGSSLASESPRHCLTLISKFFRVFVRFRSDTKRNEKAADSFSLALFSHPKLGIGQAWARA